MLRLALQAFIDKVHKKVVDNTPVATGRTVNSYRKEVGDDFARLVMQGGYFGALVRGRGPRKTNTESGFREALAAWMQAKGLSTEGSNVRSLQWYINTHGTSLFRSGQKSDLGMIDFENEIRDLQIEIGGRMQNEIMIELNKHFKR